MENSKLITLELLKAFEAHQTAKYLEAVKNHGEWRILPEAYASNIPNLIRWLESNLSRSSNNEH